MKPADRCAGPGCDSAAEIPVGGQCYCASCAAAMHAQIDAAMQMMDFAHGNLAASSRHRPSREAFCRLWAERGLPPEEFGAWAEGREWREAPEAALDLAEIIRNAADAAMAALEPELRRREAQPMTDAEALAESVRRWGALGIACWTREGPPFCQVGEITADGRLAIHGRGPTWERAFEAADRAAEGQR